MLVPGGRGAAAISSAFSEEKPLGRGLTSIMSVRVTMACPATLDPSGVVVELPSINQVSSASSNGSVTI